MKDLFAKIVPGLVTGLVLAVFGFYINHKKEGVNHLDLLSNSTHTSLKKMELEEKKIKIIYDDQQVYDLSSVNISLYNFTEKAYKDVDVLIEITPDDGDSIRFLKPEIFGENGKKEFIKYIIDSVPKDFIKTPLKFRYVIEHANAPDTLKPIFTGSFDMISGKTPKSTVTIIADGLAAAPIKYDWNHYDEIKTSIWTSLTAIIIYFIIGYAFIIYLLIKTMDFFSLKRNKRWKVYLKEKLSELKNSRQLHDDPDTIMHAYNKISSHFDYKDMSDFKKWITKAKEPEGYNQ